MDTDTLFDQAAPGAIRSRRIITPEGVFDGAVLVADGLITDVVPATDVPEGALDVGGHMLFPGFVDTHVHINEPGRTDWEGFDTATRAAASAGITTLVDMPLNSLPVTTTPDALRAKTDSASGQLHVDVGFYGGVVPENAARLNELLDAGVLGLKAFMIDSGIPEFPASGAYELRCAMRALAGHGKPLLVHAEVAGLGRKPGPTATAWASSRPQHWEQDAIDLLIDLCQTYQTPTHIVHLAAAKALPALRAARAQGLPITVETCPHYLYFALEGIDVQDPLFKCAPPIRSVSNRRKLWQALNNGDIDLVASDHSPASPDLKTGSLLAAWGGVASLDLGPSVIWTLLRRERPERLAEWMSQRPADLVGLLDRGAIEVGRRADLAVFDPDAVRHITPDMLHTRHKISPYVGQVLTGAVTHTFLSGRCVFQRGTGRGMDHFRYQPIGQTVLRP
ncbi:MAG: allantoinase [Rhodothermales bacterium]|jgi:allantoinase